MGRSRPRGGPPGENGPPFDMAPPGPGWGPPPPRGWGPPPGGWGPPPPDDWGPPPPDGWGPRGPPPPCWGPPPPGWPCPEDWIPPEDWAPPPGGWRPPRPDDWRRPRYWDPEAPPHPGWGPSAWGPEMPPDPWGPEPPPPVPPPAPPPPPALVIPPPDAAAYGPPVPPPAAAPPLFFPGFPPPAWPGEPLPEEVMPNPPPDQPEWIKALISAPPPEGPAPPETKAPPPEDPPAPAPPDAPKAEPRTSKPIGLLGKRTFDKPPPGRSTGIISFVGPNFGHIEREDLEKFTFSFSVFFGNPKAMKPGVRVHFTACKEKNSQIATDVKVAPGGTENVDPEIYEAVVSQPIVEPQPGERQYPGQVHVHIEPLRTSLAFERKDSAVTLLKDDHVLVNLLTDIVSEKRRATNIRPQIPATFCHTKETRHTGVVVSLKDNEGVIRSETQGELPFDVKENFSDVDFAAEDVNEEVEFTVISLRAGKRAVRIRRAKEPLLLSLCGAGRDPEDDAFLGGDAAARRSRGKAKPEPGPNVKLDTELYEGIVSQPIIEPTANSQGYPGQIHANIGPIRTNVTFDHRDCGVTLLKNDHVLINLLVDLVTRKRRAANIKPKIPFTFSYTKEKRETGVISSLGSDEGAVSSREHGELPFDVCENFSDTEFNPGDLHKEVEFTVAQVRAKKRAIRLRRKNPLEDKVLQEQKRREEEEQKEADRKKKEEAAAALAAARDKWTPLGFVFQDPSSSDEVSKERFEGTVLQAISRNPRNPRSPRKEVKKDPESAGAQEGIEVKEEKLEEQQVQGQMEGEEETKEVTVEKGGGAKAAAAGRLVMTLDGLQKQLPFGPGDLLTSATMLDGDKVRFNISTHRETRAERAANVELLPASFEESMEQRRHGIVIEFLEDSGLIKCSQNPQLFFHMSEVIEKKKLELNEKVEFSVVPLGSVDGGMQAIRIKRFTENVFLPVRKLGGVGATKGKMTIKLTKTSKDTEKEIPGADKLKAVVKNLRARGSGSAAGGGGRSRSPGRGRDGRRSRSPSRDKFGRAVKRRRASSAGRQRKAGRHKRSRSRERSRRRTRSRSRTSDKSPSRGASKDRAGRKKSKLSGERQETHKRRREPSPAPRRAGVVDDELARKKRELEELNEMIAYKKSLVDPRGPDPGRRTCIDYNHGRIAVPLTEYKPVRSILKKRVEAPEYGQHPLQPFQDPYYDRPYGLYGEPYGERYGDSFSGRPFPEPYGEGGLYADPSPDGPSSGAPRFTDRYDVYDQTFEERFLRRVSVDPQRRPVKSSEPRGPSTPSPSAVSSSSRPAFRPPSPTEPLPGSRAVRPEPATSRRRPLAEKPPLDRFLDMLNKKADAERNCEPSYVTDDLLPHERALQDGKGFSRLVGLTQDPPGGAVTSEERQKRPGPRQTSAETPAKEATAKTEPYDKIKSLLRTIGLRLSTGDVSELAGRAQEKLCAQKSSSAERDAFVDRRGGRSGSAEATRSPSPARASSLEPVGGHKAVLEYDPFLDKHELETLKKAQELQSLSMSLSGTSSPSHCPKPPPGPPPVNYKHPSPPLDWPLRATSPVAPSRLGVGPGAGGQTSQRFGSPPGPPPGPPPRRPGPAPPGPPPGPPPPRRSSGQPPFLPPANEAGFGFAGQLSVAPPADSSGPPSPSTPPVTSAGPFGDDRSAISTTVARCLKVIETVKCLAAQPGAKPVKLVQFSLPTETSSASGVGTAPETDQDTRTKQKEKPESFNQRLWEKREQHFKDMQAGKKVDSTGISSGKLLGSEPKTVWICGHSLVYWAESRAKSPEVGMQLGMDPGKVAIWWKGIQGMTWPQLLPQLHQLKVTWPNPDVLIVHLGGNDLSTDSPTDLLASVKKDLTSMRSIFPQCALVWSNILPRRAWRHSSDSHEVDLVRTTVNRRVHNIISHLGGTSLSHENIRCGANTGLYRPDGVHLSPKGLDLFNLNLQEFLEKWEMEVNKTSE